MALFARVPIWRNTPPAVFPPILGLFGLALAWRAAGPALGLSVAVSELLFGMVTLIYLFSAGAYLAKFIARPGVLLQDLSILPGRLGLPAATMSGMLLAGGLSQVAPTLATLVLWAAVMLHGCLALLIIYVLLRGPEEQRKVTPAWQLGFVGFIVAGVVGVPLGLNALAITVTAATVPVAALVIAVSLAQLWSAPPPAPLRPLLAIHLAPISLFGTVLLLMGQTAGALGFAVLAILIVAVLLAFAPQITRAGFSPLWGAFTFPMAAFAGLMLRLAPQGYVFAALGAAGLAAATIAIPWIALKVLRMWPQGALSARTNAAVA